MTLVAGALCLCGSVSLPYWEMSLDAKQYQRPLSVVAYPDRITGDISEIDLLNHYIGMRKLDQAAVFERSIGRGFVLAMAAVMLLTAVIGTRWSPLLLLPVVLFPALFLLDLHWWLRDFGLNLDPHAPMNRSIKPFVPTILGVGKVGQFTTHARIGIGMYLALIASGASLLFAYVRWLKWHKRPNAPSERTGAPSCATTAAGACLVLSLSAPSLPAATWEVRENGAVTKLADALDQAGDGDTIAVYGGIHPGPLVVNKRVRLIGHGWPVIDGHQRGTVVTLSAAGIEMQGFRVRGSGDKLANEDGDGGILATAEQIVIQENRLEDVLFGMSFRNSHRSTARGNVLSGKHLDIGRRGDLIRLWWSHDVLIEGNDVAGGRDVVLWYSKRLTIRDNTVRNGRYGIHFMYCDDAKVVGNYFHGNSVGSFLMYSRDVHLERNWIENNRGASGYGVGLKDMESYVLKANVVVNNRTAIFMEGASGEVSGNLIGYNERGATIFTSCRNNTFHDNAFIENGEQVVVEGNTTLAAGNQWRANYWSDYRGLDGNADGVGDSPYRPQQVFESLAVRNSGMKLFTHGAAAEAIDYAANMFPVFAPRVKFTDPQPRMTAPAPPLNRPLHRNWPFFPLGSCLLIGVAACLLDWPGQALQRDSAAAPSRSRPSARLPETVAIKVSGLSKRFGAVSVLRNVAFELRSGSAVALWGPNGSGKTTLMRCLLGLLPFEGECEVFGRRCGLRSKESRRLLGYVPQEVKLRADHTVIGCVRFYAALRAVPLQRGVQLLEEWGLSHVHGRQVRHLSGGMLQKLGLVLALLSDPPVLLLDEPTSNLDVATREEFGRLLARLKAAGKTLLFCTHRSGEILSLADRVIVLRDGAVAADGTPDELRDRLLRPAVLRLIVPAEQREAAVQTLQSGGFAARADGGEIWLDVPAGRKPEVIVLLNQADITVFDFDVESDRGVQEQGP